eukprot:g20532.t1
MVSRMRALARVNSNKAELVETEAELKRITEDLQIPMLSDIRRAVQSVKDREVTEGVDEKALCQAVQETIQKELDSIVSHGHRSVREVVSEKGQVMSRLGRVRFDELTENEDVVGEGTFGVVLSGEYMGQEVAIKKTRDLIGDPAVLHEFRREAELHFVIHHENIVRLIAFHEGSPKNPPCMVMERMEESLSSFLATVKIPPSVGDRLEIVKDVCKGLLFLHQHRITHCDVKSANVLLDQAGTAKLSDFGLAVVADTLRKSTASYRAPTTGQNEYAKVGSEQYMAPEIHRCERPTIASDVFSLHVVTWEVLTHQTVGRGTSIGERLLHSPDARLLIGGSVPEEHRDGLQALLDKCGNTQGKERPPMADVLLEVNFFLERVTAETTKTRPAIPEKKPAAHGEGDESTGDSRETCNQTKASSDPASRTSQQVRGNPRELSRTLASRQSISWRTPFHGHVPAAMVFGKSGVGKSYLCNCLLYGSGYAEEGFSTGGGLYPVTTECEAKSVERTSDPLKMIDTPGIPSPAGRTPEIYDQIVETLRDAGGLHAFILVLEEPWSKSAAQKEVDMYGILLTQFAKLPVAKIVVCQMQANTSGTAYRQSTRDWVTEVLEKGGMNSAKQVYITKDATMMSQLSTLRSIVTDMPWTSIGNWNTTKTCAELKESAERLADLETRKVELEARKQRLESERKDLDVPITDGNLVMRSLYGMYDNFSAAISMYDAKTWRALRAQNESDRRRDRKRDIKKELEDIARELEDLKVLESDKRFLADLQRL